MNTYTMNTTKGAFNGDLDTLAARLAEFAPSRADLDGTEIDIPFPDESVTDEEWVDACRAAVSAAIADA